MDVAGLTLTSERLVLSGYQPSDAAEVFAAITPPLARWMSWEAPVSQAELAEVLGGLAAKMQDGAAFDPAVIRLAATGEFLGMSGVHKLDEPEPEPGIWIKEAAHGHGYGREAVRTVIDWAATHGFASVVYPVAEANAPSRRLAEALGGEAFGARPMVKPGGARFPMVLYQIPAPCVVRDAILRDRSSP